MALSHHEILQAKPGSRALLDLETGSLWQDRPGSKPDAQDKCTNVPNASTNVRTVTTGSVSTSGYPDNNPKTAAGASKTRLDLVPPALLTGAAEAFANGAEKYGPFNWRENKISSSVYYAACLRHLFAWYDRADPDDNATDSGVHHLKHAVACLALILDTKDSDKLNDNRPPKCQ